MAAPAIQAEGLTKSYGSSRGVVDLAFEVERGEVFGYLGPNGAGKTTTIRLLLDLIRPTRGRASVLGLDARRDSVEVRRHVGYVPGELALYPRLTGREHLSFYASLRGGVDPRAVDDLVERLDLDLDRPVADLSKGNRQKIALAQALMHRPELLVLDEPTSGLDPLVQQEFYRLVRERTAAGGTVLLSSHVLSEVEHVADRVAIVREGRLVVVEDVAGLKARAVRRLVVHFAAPVAAEPLASLPGVRSVEADGTGLRFEVEGSLDTLVKAIAAHEVVDIVSHEPDLEEIFLSYYREGERGAA
ncbi:MAG TPA: ABC transporter ATP-binding protein [Gaiellaceae bacterium]